MYFSSDAHEPVRAEPGQKSARGASSACEQHYTSTVTRNSQDGICNTSEKINESI